MNVKVLTYLKAFKIFDPDNTLSLSNVAFMVVIAKIAMAGTLDWTIIIPFALTLLNHNARKHWRSKSEAKTIADTERLAKVEDQVRSLTNAQAFNRK